MKSIRTIAALIAVIGMGSYAQASHDVGCGASKCCDCAPTFQPTCCKPKIVRPCHRNIYNYQRQFVKSCCIDPGCGNGCGSPAQSCCPTGAGNGAGCVDPNNCGAGNGCGNGCTDPNNCGAGNGCGAGAGTCAAPCGAGNGAGCVDPNNCGAGNGCGNGCTDPNSCTGGADSCCATACCNDACEIAELIYQSQTGCKGYHRRRALSKLGRKYDCVCHPEIMSAFIYSLNDADHRVRRTAADKIGDELRKNKCCCSQCVVDALTIALADCDRGVRRQAEQALKQCGYDIVNPTCTVATCDTGCVGDGCGDPNACCHGAGNGCVGCGTAPAYSPAAAPAAPAQAPATAPAVAPAPPAEPKAYFPRKNGGDNARPVSSMKSLKNVFGLAR